MSVRGNVRSKLTTGLTTMVAMAVLAPAAPAQFDPVVEQQNFSKTQERQTIYTTPQYQLLLQQVSA